MKKHLLYMAGLLLLSCAGIASCTDDDDAGVGADGRMFMTLYRNNNNTKIDDGSSTACHPQGNNIQLYWYGVNGAAGYQLRAAIVPYVSGGSQAWQESAEKGRLVLDTCIMDPECLSYELKGLQYGTDYRFAIRTLSPKGEGYHSKWWGEGGGQQWADYLNVQTEARYATPAVLSVSGVEKTSMRINIDRTYDSAISGATPDEVREMDEHFDITTDAAGRKVFVFDKFTVEPSPDNPDAPVPDRYRNYQLTDEDFARGYIDVQELDSNSIYNINVENTHNTKGACHWDDLYETLTMRTDGTPGEPILIPWSCNPNDVIVDEDGVATVIPGVADYQACKIDSVIMNFNKDPKLAEGQIFYLEGGKNYYTYMNVELCKGFKLATNPADLAAGKGRAHVFLGGLSKDGNGRCRASNNFMFGRQPKSGELGSIYVKSVIFEDIDFDCPTADNGAGSAGTGNYFANMYSNGLGVTFQSVEIRRCSFQRMVRGFIRIQGSKAKTFEHLIIEDCEMLNSGYYQANKGGYSWIAAEGEKTPKSNIFKDVVVRRNTIFDCPRGSFFSGTKNSEAVDNWKDDVRYNITFNNNTFVNFSTHLDKQYIFAIPVFPGGSRLECKNNLFVMSRSAEDTGRIFYACGANTPTVKGSGVLDLDFKDNYSTNLGKGSSNTDWQTLTQDNKWFTKDAFSKAYGEFYKGDKSDLEIKLGNNGGISPEELFMSPNPPHRQVSQKDDHLVSANSGIPMGEIDTQTGQPIYAGNLEGLNGSKVNLYYQNTPKVLASEIYQKQIGAPKWREGIGRGAAARRAARRR